MDGPRGVTGWALISIVVALWNCAPVQAAADLATVNAYQKSYELEAKGEFAEAIKALKQAASREKTSYFYLLRYGWLHRCDQRYRVSAMYYRMAAQKIPNSIEALLGKLNVEVALEQWDDAKDTAAKIIRTDPQNYAARSTLAYADFLNRKYLAAQRGYERVLKRYPSDLTMKEGLGWSLLWQGKRKDGMEVFRQILEIAPQNEAAQKALGEDAPTFPGATAEAYQRSYRAEAEGDYEGALKALQNANTQDKQDYHSTIRSAWLKALKGDHKEAADLYAQAAALAPLAVQPLQGKLQSEVVRGKWDDVTKTALDLLRLDPKSYTGRFNLAQAYYFLERFPIAERLYLSIIRDYPGDLSARSGLGWSQLKQGRTAEAVRSFRTILQVCPSHALAKKGLEAAEALKTAGR